jgi:hypothetical protein
MVEAAQLLWCKLHCEGGCLLAFNREHLHSTKPTTLCVQDTNRPPVWQTWWGWGLQCFYNSEEASNIISLDVSYCNAPCMEHPPETLPAT